MKALEFEDKCSQGIYTLPSIEKYTRVYTLVYPCVHCCIHACTQHRSKYVPNRALVGSSPGANT